jgi:hypothetical protein
LEYSACLRFGGICGDSNGGRGIWKLKRSCGEEELFCSCERGVHGRSPGKGFRSTTEGISERAKYTSNVGKKTAVEIEESQKTLELFD